MEDEDPTPFLEYDKEIRMKDNHLTLWDQIGKIQHATFHLNDSIPTQERDFLHHLKENFLKSNPKPWDAETQKRYYKIVGKRLDTLLDNGYGRCIFKDPIIRKELEDAIHYYDEKYYYLHSFVIMPNHVHMLLIMKEEYNIEIIIGNLKRFVSSKINNILGEKGEKWYKETYCRLMRSKEHFNLTKNYIRQNPKNLRRGEFTYWEENSSLG